MQTLSIAREASVPKNIKKTKKPQTQKTHFLTLLKLWFIRCDSNRDESTQIFSLLLIKKIQIKCVIWTDRASISGACPLPQILWEIRHFAHYSNYSQMTILLPLTSLKKWKKSVQRSVAIIIFCETKKLFSHRYKYIYTHKI